MIRGFSAFRRIVFVWFAWSWLCGNPVAWAGRPDKTLDIYWIDVEGGAATLIVTPAGESILVDSGNPGIRDPQRIMKVVAQEAQLRHIDHLVTTHYHRDHYGGAQTLSTMIPIKHLHDNGQFEGMPDNPGKAYFELKCEKRLVIHPGQQIPLTQTADTPPLRLTCLAARKTFISVPGHKEMDNHVCEVHPAKDRDGSDNANSVVLVLDFGDFRFFDGGDLTWNQEHRLVCPVNRVGTVDVYQVTHHGLDSSNNPAVLKALQPTVAVMNNGVTKGCRPEVFETLTNTDSIQAIYQMHKNLRPDGDRFNTKDTMIANLEQDCAGHFIKLTVASDGKTYGVGIPANGHQQRYTTTLKTGAPKP